MYCKCGSSIHPLIYVSYLLQTFVGHICFLLDQNKILYISFWLFKHTGITLNTWKAIQLVTKLTEYVMGCDEPAHLFSLMG